jgi:hypothetical protein
MQEAFEDIHHKQYGKSDCHECEPNNEGTNRQAENASIWSSLMPWNNKNFFKEDQCQLGMSK